MPPSTETKSSDDFDKAADNLAQTLRAKILFGLGVYPFLSPSMLHVFVGTAIPSSIWKEQVLEGLIAEGLIVREEIQLTSAYERSQTYTILHLTQNAYRHPNPCAEIDMSSHVADIQGRMIRD